MRLLFITLLAGTLWVCGSAQAETFEIPLALESGTLPDGEALIASFQLPRPFKRIDSVVISFAMPDGFESYTVTTGNSTYGNHLDIALLPADAPLPRLNPLSRSGITQLITGVPPGEEYSVPIYSLFDLLAPSKTTWPEFLLQGMGRVAFAEVQSSSYHPLPAGQVVRSSSTQGLPNEISDARLVIVGQLVPEPSTAAVMLIAAFALVALRRR